MPDYLLFRVCESFLGAVCFGLIQAFGMPFDGRGTSSLVMFKMGICNVASYGFPFLVQIPFLLAYVKHGRIFQHNILNPIVSMIGVIMYLAAGSMGLNVLLQIDQPKIHSWYSSDIAVEIRKWKAVASMLIITGIVYFLDFIYWIAFIRNAPEQSPGQRSPPQHETFYMTYNQPKFG